MSKSSGEAQGTLKAEALVEVIYRAARKKPKEEEKPGARFTPESGEGAASV